jgi:hypothetical protein
MATPLSTFSGRTTTLAQASESEATSLIRLIAAPSDYDGKWVRVIGVAQVEFEQDVLYVTRLDFDNRVLTNAIGLSFGRTRPTSEQVSYSGSYVAVEGLFRARRAGTRQLQSGTITSLKRFERWEPPSPRRESR